MPNDADRTDHNEKPDARPQRMIDPGFTGQIPVTRGADHGERSTSSAASGFRQSHRAETDEPDLGDDSGHFAGRREAINAAFRNSPLARRVLGLTAVIVIGAPIAAALRPGEIDAEALPSEVSTLAVGGLEATSDTNSPILLNPGAGGTSTKSTVSLDDLPTLQKPGSTSSGGGIAAAEASCQNTYTVISGDSWSYIADKADTTTSALLAANDATTRTMLQVGDTICLPAGATVPTRNTTSTTNATTTTKVTTTTSAPTTTTYTTAQIEQMIRDIWPDAIEDQAIAIAYRESRLDPYAKNYCCYGLFQIYWDVHKTWLIGHGITSATQLFDPRVNTYVGYMVYQRSGSFSPWGF